MDDRSVREKDAYDSQHVHLKSYSYQSILSHCKIYYSQYITNLIGNILSDAEGNKVLEIGSNTWYYWICPNNIKPEEIVCINISENGISRGIQRAKKVNLNIKFKIMDANNLEFEDGEFDIVYGGQILHHLDFFRALAEIYRVLKKNGQIVFREPLGINPISKMIRLLTPHARTRDEKPLGYEELDAINELFETRYYYEQLASVPLGILSRMLFNDPVNVITKTAFHLDRFIENKIPPLRPYFRDVVIHGKKR